MVKIWLYCSLLKNCIPGRANSARSTSARTPAIKNQAKDVIRYKYPIVLWSVDVIHFTNDLPFAAGAGDFTVVVGRSA